MIVIYELDLYWDITAVQIWASYVKAFESYCLTDIATDRQTDRPGPKLYTTPLCGWSTKALDKPTCKCTQSNSVQNCCSHYEAMWNTNRKRSGRMAVRGFPTATDGSTQLNVPFQNYWSTPELNTDISALATNVNDWQLTFGRSSTERL